MRDCIVIGGGQAGLATAYYLRRDGIEPLILDDQNGPGAAWRHVWPSMTLFSSASFSHLPGMPMPRYDGFPPASHVIAYLEKYEERYGFEVRRPVHVSSLSWTGSTYALETSVGAMEARTVVAASGTWSAPYVPFVPGAFDGTQWHSARYPGPKPFEGKRVAVVGAKNSGAQIAAELTRVADVTWYTRHEPRWMADDVDGRVLFEDAHRRVIALMRGEPDPGPGPTGDIVMMPEVLEARDSGRLKATPMFNSLDQVKADHLIWCTGFRPSLRVLREVLDSSSGTPVPLHPGLFLVGYGDIVGPGAATITGVGPFAKRAAAGVKELLND